MPEQKSIRELPDKKMIFRTEAQIRIGDDPKQTVLSELEVSIEERGDETWLNITQSDLSVLRPDVVPFILDPELSHRCEHPDQWTLRKIGTVSTLDKKINALISTLEHRLTQREYRITDVWV